MENTESQDVKKAPVDAKEPIHVKKSTKGCVTVLFIIIVVSIIGFCVSDSEEKMPSEGAAYVMATSIIEEDASGKSGFNEIDCPLMDYHAEYLNDSTYLIVSHFTYKNDFGVEKRFDYKARVKWVGGKEESRNSWEMIYIEAYN